MRNIIVSFLCLSLFSGCTFNFTMAHTQGYANDLVDDTTEEKFDPELSIPLKAL